MSIEGKILGGMFLALCFVVGLLLPIPSKQYQPPQAQPSVPALIAPACDGRCNPARVSNKPFTVVCPSCRSTLSVQPSATGSTVTGYKIQRDAEALAK